MVVLHNIRMKDLMVKIEEREIRGKLKIDEDDYAKLLNLDLNNKDLIFVVIQDGINIKFSIVED